MPKSSAPGPLRVGDLVAGKYRVERVLGHGGMGMVVAARHEALDQRVAIKCLLPIHLDDEGAARFQREARAVAKLHSDHSVRVMDVGELAGGIPYMIMEYLEGVDLARLVGARGPLPVVEAVGYVLQALDALAEAHAVGIVHRDLKPANLFLVRRPDGRGSIKVLDFGISKAPVPMVGQGGRSLTPSFVVIGSPHYVSPEQVRSAKSVDARADIWSAGVTLYELLAARLPFSSAAPRDVFALYEAVLTGTPEPLESIRPDVPEGLVKVVAKCLERDRDKRYADAAALALALGPYGPPESATRAPLESTPWPAAAPEVTGSPDPGMDTVGAHQTTVPIVARRRSIRALAAGALVGTALVGVAWLLQWSRRGVDVGPGAVTEMSSFSAPSPAPPPSDVPPAPAAATPDQPLTSAPAASAESAAAPSATGSAGAPSRVPSRPRSGRGRPRLDLDRRD